MDPVKTHPTIRLHELHRDPVTIVDAFSGATFERAELADGTPLFLKHLPAEGDWMTRAAGGTDHLRQLWDSGALDRLSSVVDHTILSIIRDDDHDVVVMRDVSESLFSRKHPASWRVGRELFAGLAALHEAGRREPVLPLCALSARWRSSDPRAHAADHGPGAFPDPDRVTKGWAALFDLVHPDVGTALQSVLDHPDALGHRLEAFEPTLLHGDLRLSNLGLAGDGMIAIDWGDLSGFGPPAVDISRFAGLSAGMLGVSPDEIFAAYESAAGVPLDPDALDLACIGAFTQFGYVYADLGGFVGTHDEATRVNGLETFRWWEQRVASALARVGPI